MSQIVNTNFSAPVHATSRVALPSIAILGISLLIAASLLAFPALAGPGHDHGDEAPVATGGNNPKRLPDGSVFLPKPAQRQLAVRTLPVESSELRQTFELAAKVVMDPNAGGRVQPLQAGRIEGGPRGLPSLGQTVRKGEVLAYVVPSSSSIERSNQNAQLAELRASKELAEKRLARMRELEGTIPRKEIEAVQSEIASLTARVSAIGGGLSTRETLVAPVSGVIASANLVAGQVVDARELAFEIVDPSRQRIEALAYDSKLVGNVGSATLAVGDERVPLKYIGSARSLREQALPMSFAAEGAAISKLAVGQPVTVFVQTGTKLSGIRVPASSLMKNPSNQTVVWVKTDSERFDARVVTVEPLDGVTVAVTSGLKKGDRVATNGASLINQVR
jgi:membrane fusion protein, heavy metal efflux system